MKLLRTLVAGSIALAACSEAPVYTVAPNVTPTQSVLEDAPGRYIVVVRGQNVPKTFEADVAAAGGTIEMAMPRIGAAVVANMNAAGASKLAAASGVMTVDADQKIAMSTRKGSPDLDASILDAQVASPTAPQAAGFYPLQWNMQAINARPAWLAGFRGSSTVSIGIIDTGIDEGTASGSRSNIDLQGRVDRVRSRSFMPEEDTVVQRLFPNAPLYTDLDGHGTNVATQASSNAFNFSGVTSGTKLVAIKACTILPSAAALADPTAKLGYCSTASVFEGLYYAVEQNLDVVNMSLGGAFFKPTCQGCTSLINRVILHATTNGVTIVVAAGNEGADLDHNGAMYNTYCDAPTVICVSATGPLSTAPNLGPPFEQIDAPAIYSNFGRSAITVAGPGGNYKIGTIGTGENAQEAIVGISYVLSLCPRLTAAAYSRAVGHAVATGPCGVVGYLGTSQASPHVAGLAALLVQQVGRNPGTIRDIIQSTADQPGASGNDPRYGHGRINVARALGVM
jgi:subtilisin family serine protease